MNGSERVNKMDEGLYSCLVFLYLITPDRHRLVANKLLLADLKLWTVKSVGHCNSSVDESWLRSGIRSGSSHSQPLTKHSPFTLCSKWANSFPADKSSREAWFQLNHFIFLAYICGYVVQMLPLCCVRAHSHSSRDVCVC